MKKIINKPENIILEMCNGLVMAHPELEFLKKYRIIKKKNIDKDKVTIVSGGGSGHEPAHAGFVGMGMLDASVCGEIFASPSQIQIYNAIKETKSNKGTLLIIKNNSGDMMNFKNAAHLSIEDGLIVDYVKVEDDIVIDDSLHNSGRRGGAGTVLVYKIAGAASELGMNLYEVKEVAQRAADNIRTLGFSLRSCTVEEKGTPTFVLGENEIEFGIGIHGESGIKMENISCADEISKKIINNILLDMNSEDLNEDVAIMINGFGATSLQELYILNSCIIRELFNKNIRVYTSFVGNYMTSIDMSGASVSVMKLDTELKYLLSKESESPGFKVSNKFLPLEYIDYCEETNEKCDDVDICFDLEADIEYSEIEEYKFTLNNMIYLVDKMSEIIIKNEVMFCELDSYEGDGDFGINLSKGFKQLKRQFKRIISKKDLNIGSFLNECSMIIMEHCTGASGPIWGSAFRSAARFVGNKKSITILNFANMMNAIVNGVQATGERSFGRGAGVGDKTLIDALVPCANSWELSVKENHTFKESFERAAQSAVEGAELTKNIASHMRTVGKMSLGYPDAGAYALGIIFTELSNSFK